MKAEDKKTLFKKLFGFRIGQRVKIWRNYWGSKEKAGYWRYGTITAEVPRYQGYRREEWKPRWKVLFGDTPYSRTVLEEDLHIVRPYKQRDLT